MQFVAIRRVPACSSDCQVSSNLGEGTSQECALRGGQREREIPSALNILLNSRCVNYLYSKRVWMGSNVDARWVKG